jgi:hypothetical protein
MNHGSESAPSEEKDMAFTDHLDIETFDLLSRMEQGAIRDRMQGDLIEPAVITHLEDLRDAGSLAVIEGLENREIRLADAWNAFLGGEDTIWRHLLQHHMADYVLVHAIRASVRSEMDDVDSATAVAESYASLCASMDAGVIVAPTYHPAIKPKPFLDDLRCGATGDRCRLVIENWVPRLERFDRSAKESGYWVPLETVEAPEIETIEIELPTGILLISDYLRAPGIHEALEGRIDAAIGHNRYDDSHSLNSERGRVATTRVVAEAANVLQVCTGNTIVGIHQTDDRLVVVDDHDSTELEPVVEGLLRAGEVSCDRWTVLLADRSHVLELMQDDGTRLDAYLASDDNDSVVVTVKPGHWRVSFGEAVQEPEAAAELGVITKARTWFAMTRIG